MSSRSKKKITSRSRPLHLVSFGPRSNQRVTFDTDPKNARSESSIAINPTNPYNIIAGSKRFTNPSTYDFSLALYATFDGGLLWKECEPLKLEQDWGGTSDPALAWDGLKNNGNAYLVALPFGKGQEKALKGIAVYKSTDGGSTWSEPILIHTSEDTQGDYKQWAAGDVNPNSPHYGNVYAAWDGIIDDEKAKLRFARTTDHGTSWKGIKGESAGSALNRIEDSESPEISVAADGTIYIVWLGKDSKKNKKPAIKFVKSTDGGDSFLDPLTVAEGITSLDAFPTRNSNGFAPRHVFPEGTFRITTVPTGCIGAEDNVIFAWADAREVYNKQRRSRIYYRRSINGGKSWTGPSSGQPLLVGDLSPEQSQHDFHPQIISTPSGEIGCAFYRFGPRGHGKSPSYLIDVVIAISTDNGKTFSKLETVTDYPWDPAVDAPNSGGDPQVTFIGEYFGLDASKLGFFPLWTDTRTGIQEIFTARVNEI